MGRGCAASASGEPITSTIEVANGINHQWEFGVERGKLHHRDGDGCAGRAGDSYSGLAALDHMALRCNRRATGQPDLQKRSGRQPCGLPPVKERNEADLLT